MNCLIKRQDGMTFEATTNRDCLLNWWTVVHVTYPSTATMYYDRDVTPWHAKKLRRAFENYTNPFERWRPGP